ncbi:MAG: RDD family protein [Rhodoglobus sp.]
MPSQTAPASDWPGKRLGLPESGPRSIARLGRRIAALTIDWAAAVLISVAFFRYDPLATLGVFAVAQVVFLLTTGGSVGHLLLGMRVVPVRGGYLGWWRPFARTALLCLVIPAAIWDRDQRGMHDRAIGTVLVRR